jgi:hypothetical protein
MTDKKDCYTDSLWRPKGTDNTRRVRREQTRFCGLIANELKVSVRNGATRAHALLI